MLKLTHKQNKQNKQNKKIIKSYKKQKDIIDPIKNAIHDNLFKEASQKIIDKNDYDEGDKIYIYLYKNGYNKKNLINWLLLNSNDYDIRMHIFNKHSNELDPKTKLKFLINVFINKDKFNFKLDNDNFDKLMNNIHYIYDNNNETLDIDLFTILYTINYNSPYFFKNIKLALKDYNFTINNTKIYDNKTIGIYTLYKQSPAFKHFIETLYYLSEYNNVILYIEEDESNFEEKYRKYIHPTNMKLEFILNKTDNELTEIINNNSHILMIFIYGFYKRRNVVLNHPAKKTIHYLEAQNLYTKNVYDYVLYDKFYYNTLQQRYNKIYHKNIDDEFNFIKLNIPINIMLPICNNFNPLNPEYNENNIKIGLICTSSRKFCNKLILIINTIMKCNSNIYFTIYTIVNNEWLLGLLSKYKHRITIKSYDNNNYKNELQNNLLYLDPVIYNNHSTGMEIIGSRRPFVSYLNNEYLFATVSSAIIEHIGMKKELCADNVSDYIKLILYHTQSKERYYQLFNKFINNISYLDDLNKIYAKELYTQLNNINN